MKNQKFGIEIEFTGITRRETAKAVKEYLGEGAEIIHAGGYYDEYHVIQADGRKWKIVYDGSIITKRKLSGIYKDAGSEYSVELVSPILRYEDIETLQGIVRNIRRLGGISESKFKNGIHIHIGAENHTPGTLKNLINLMASKEDLIYKSLDIDPTRINYCKKINENMIGTINKKKPNTLEDLADIWYSDYSRQSRGRHYHTSRYQGLNFHSIFEKGTIEFRLFNGTNHAGIIRAYIMFCLAVSNQALKQKTASARRTITDNPKYTFRCWLLRLGMIGDEFKNCRLHLMKKLTGNSAWRQAA